jgi:hypothetical protein
MRNLGLHFGSSTALKNLCNEWALRCSQLLSSLRLARNTINMTVNDVLGVVVLVRNGDRIEYYQDPETYSGAYTQTTALGEVMYSSVTSSE